MKGVNLSINTVIMLAMGALVFVAAGTMVVSAGDGAKKVGDNRISDAKCKIHHQDYKLALQCENAGDSRGRPETQRAKNVKNDWKSKCPNYVWDANKVCSNQ